MRSFVIYIVLLSYTFIARGQELNPSKILTQLLDARGEVRSDYPTIRVVDRIKNIAAFAPATNEIILERKAIAECMKLGNEAEAALAFIISHELTHFFQHKVWSSQKNNVAFFSSSKEFEKLKPYEKQADTYGAFLCYLANFDYEDAAPKIIEKLYTSYQLRPENLIGYPEPDQRKLLTLSVCQQVDKFIIYFEAANALSFYGQYNRSQALLTHLLQYLDFKELYNNTGVNQFKLVLSHLPEEMKYPLIVKKALALRTGLSLSLDSLLFRAHENFVAAVDKDPTDHDLFINLASVKLQLGWIDQFNELLTQLKSVNLTRSNLQRLEILEAILLVKQGKTGEAQKNFRGIKSSSDDELIRQTCEQNLQILRQKKEKPFLKKTDEITFMPKELDISAYSSEKIDWTDPMFPVRCDLRKDGNTIQIDLSKGREKIILWRIPQQETNNSNTYFSESQGSKYAWIIQ